jgi:hypothetical protein
MSQLVKTKRQASFQGFKLFGAFKGLFWHSWANLHTNSSNNSSLFNEFVCNLGFFWHEWAQCINLLAHLLIAKHLWGQLDNVHLKRYKD